jgi:tRNA pseudouridine65 synthase
MEIPVIYQDEYCLVVNKPNNMLVHHSKYAGDIDVVSLVEHLRQQGFPTACPVHRLDRKTSGVLLFAKHPNYVNSFQELFESKTIVKTYHALLRGFVDESGILDSPVKNDRGNYKEALTKYRCLNQFILPIPVQPYSEARYSLVEFTPETGRMHQLRIHANKMSHPIIGDPKYGNRHHNHMFQEKLDIPYLFLHAMSLEFIHPFTTIKMSIKAAIPDFWEDFLGLEELTLV